MSTWKKGVVGTQFSLVVAVLLCTWISAPPAGAEEGTWSTRYYVWKQTDEEGDPQPDVAREYRYYGNPNDEYCQDDRPWCLTTSTDFHVQHQHLDLAENGDLTALEKARAQRFFEDEDEGDGANEETRFGAPTAYYNCHTYVIGRTDIWANSIAKIWVDDYDAFAPYLPRVEVGTLGQHTGSHSSVVTGITEDIPPYGMTRIDMVKQKCDGYGLYEADPAAFEEAYGPILVCHNPNEE